MKNLLRSSLYLAVFAIAGILFQISCSSDSLSPNSTPIGKIIFTKKVGTQLEIWTANYDGSGQTQVPVILPANVYFNYAFGEQTSFDGDSSHVHLSPDGQTVFFETINDPTGTRSFSIYSCDVSGNNLTEIVNGGTNQAPMVI